MSFESKKVILSFWYLDHTNLDTGRGGGKNPSNSVGVQWFGDDGGH